MKAKAFENLDAMAKEADLFAEARGGVFSCVNKGQRDNYNKGAAHSKPESKSSGKPEIKCGICGKGHLTIRCYKNPNRKQAYSAEVASGSSGSKGSNSDYGCENEQGTQIKSEESESSRGRGYTRGRGRGYFRGRGKTDGAPRGSGHQMRFCKTEVSKESDDGIESIYQSKIDSSLKSDSKIKEGVCYFLKSRLPTAEGTVNSRKAEVRDTGCTFCTVKRSLVSDDQLIGKESYVTLIDETAQRYPLEVIDVDCPFFTRKTEALCMEDTLYDLVIGNIDRSKLPDMSHFLQRQLLDLRLSKAKMLVGNLRFLIRLLMKIRRL